MNTIKRTVIYTCLLFFAGYVLASPAPAHATNTGPFTLEIWVNPNTSIASKAIVGKAEELRLATDASEYPTCQFKATTWQTAATGTTVITLNNWTHLACTYDKTTLRLYANGIQVATQSLSSTPDDTANVWRLGQDDSSSTPYTNFNGTVDNFQFYNYARTPKQIIEDMNGGKSALTSPLGHWKFDEGQGTIANNSGSGGGSLNETLTNMASPATATSG